MTPPAPENDLPPLYARWMDRCLGGPIPRETRATCFECAMAAPGKDRPDGPGDSFDPGVKCCSFVPHLANFLAGRLLLDPDPALDDGRRTLGARIDARRAISPYGVSRRARDFRGGPHTFGRAGAPLCPHFTAAAGGRCTIWRHREATCATYFCKFARGAVGKRFWDATRALLEAVEGGLARHCVEALDPGEAARARLFAAPAAGADPPHTLDGAADAAGYAEVWGRFLGREREFNAECARLVEALHWDYVRRILGPALVGEPERAAREAHAALLAPGPEAADDPPLRLVQIRKLKPDPARARTWLYTYSPIDPIAVPDDVLAALARFDGRRPTPEALEALARETGRPLEPAALRALVDHRVLEALIPTRLQP